MAYSTLHPGGSGAKALDHFRIEDLGHRVNDVHILYRQDDGLPEILVALDVGGYAHLVDNGGDHGLQGAG